MFKVKLTHGGKIQRENEFDSGLDVFCKGYRKVINEKLQEERWFDETDENHVVLRQNETMLLLTGVQIQPPVPQKLYAYSEDGNHTEIGCRAIEVQVRGRSGLSLKQDSTVKLGTGDNPYRGVYGIIFKNTSNGVLIINDDDKIAQLVFNEVIIPNQTAIEIVDNFEFTPRGDKGFGSSGVK